MIQRAVVSFSLAALGILVSCGASDGARPSNLALGEATTPAVKPPFEDELLAAAREYRTWTRVSDRANRAPTLCMAPAPAGVQRSDSADPQTHGRKLYYLFAKDADTYVNLDHFESFESAERDALERRLVGQVVVKESWEPVEIPLGSVPKLPASQHDRRTIPDEYAIEGDRAFRTGEQRDLFVMLKLDPATSGTDVGWVYGTLTPDGRRVTSAGRVASCMNCHADAPRDRLFGLFPPQRSK